MDRTAKQRNQSLFQTPNKLCGIHAALLDLRMIWWVTGRSPAEPKETTAASGCLSCCLLIIMQGVVTPLLIISDHDLLLTNFLGTFPGRNDRIARLSELAVQVIEKRSAMGPVG